MHNVIREDHECSGIEKRGIVYKDDTDFDGHVSSVEKVGYIVLHNNHSYSLVRSKFTSDFRIDKNNQR